MAKDKLLEALKKSGNYNENIVISKTKRENVPSESDKFAREQKRLNDYYKSIGITPKQPKRDDSNYYKKRTEDLYETYGTYKKQDQPYDYLRIIQNELKTGSMRKKQ